MSQIVKAIFLDRDGVLIKDNNLITTFSQVELYPLVGEAIAEFRKLGYKIFLITNQTVVSRGLLTFEKMLELNHQILDLIKKQNSNAYFDDVFICPHHPSATLAEFRIDCECRKPKSGMLLLAKHKHSVDLENSIVIGDRPSDIYAGKNVGCLGIQLNNGFENESLIETTINLKPEHLVPDYSFKSLYEAAIFIKSEL